MMFSIPPKGQVDVWIVNTHTLSDDDRLTCETVLNDNERSRLKNFRIEDARLQYLITRCLVRTALSCYVNKNPADWSFVKNQYGRPRLADEQVKEPIHFNVSHTSKMVVCAFSRTEEIGIDVECVDRDMDHLSLAHQVFADSEIASLVSASDREKRELFFSHWTLKEAYIKARGMGLSLPMKAFSFELEDDSQKIYFSSELADDPQRWQFMRHSPTEQHRLAIAVSFMTDPVDININYRSMSISDIVAIIDPGA
jgi:4'-phosphopantetheinyl transferase